MKASAVWLLGVMLVPMVALAQAPAADVNTITAVQVNGGTVSIIGTKKPNFTTFTMTDPPRLVIDISEAVFSGVSEEVLVGNGTVTGIRTASYGSDASAIARVLIGYEREVETDIQANGNQLVVRVAGGGGQAVAQAPAAPVEQPAVAAQPTADGTAAQAAAAAQADRQAQEKAAAQAAAAAQADRQAQEKAAAQAAAAAEADRQAQEKAAAQAAASAQQDAAAERKRQEEARAETQRQEEAARAAAQAQAAEEKKRQQEEARASAKSAEEERRAAAQAAAEEKKRQQEEARASAKSAEEERRASAQAAAEEKKRQAAAAAEERKAQAAAAAEERRQRQEEARASRDSRKQETVAMAEPPRERPRREVSGGSDASAEVSSRRKRMTLVGFQQQSGASRVFIRTNEPVRYTASEDGRAVVVELENTRIDQSNHTRPLDTSFFSSPVTRVEADSAGRAVRVTIQLRDAVPFQARQEGNLISLDFQRPGR